MNGEVVDYFQMNHDDKRDFIPSPPPYNFVESPAEDFGFTVANDYNGSVLVKLKIGDVVSFFVAELPYQPTENYADGCKTGDITHSCSSITGEYLYL